MPSTEVGLINSVQSLRAAAPALNDAGGMLSYRVPCGALERAIQRSKAPLPLPAPTIEHEPAVSAEEMKRPFSRYRRY